MGERVKVADVSDLPSDGSRMIVETQRQEIGIFRYDGEFHAIANYCVHQSGPLCEGPLTGEMTLGDDGWEWVYDDEPKNVVCPWHGWKFDITSGENIDDDRYRVPTYEVEVEDGALYLVLP